MNLTKDDLSLLLRTLKETDRSIGKLTRTLAEINQSIERIDDPEGPFAIPFGGNPTLNLIDKLADSVNDQAGVTLQLLTILTMFALDERLKSTFKALFEMGEAAAIQVAEKTGRTELTERRNLNRLVEIGYVDKYEVGSTAKFSVKKFSEIPLEQILNALGY